MKIQEFNEMTRVFNTNLHYIRMKMHWSDVQRLMNEYKADDHGHLAKILMLRGIDVTSA